MDRILIVFYSYSGVSRRAANFLASHRGWALGEITEERPRSGAWGGVRCVIDSLLHRRPRIRYEGPNPADYATVVIVSPLWMGQMAAPMRSFLSQNAIRVRRVAQIPTMNASGASNAEREAAHLLHRTPVYTASFYSHDIEDGSATSDMLRAADEIASGDAYLPQARRTETRLPAATAGGG
jgi:flavodoxin